MSSSERCSATHRLTRKSVRKFDGVLSHRVLGALIACAWLSGCLVEAPECTDCAASAPASDAGAPSSEVGAEDAGRTYSSPEAASSSGAAPSSSDSTGGSEGASTNSPPTESRLAGETTAPLNTEPSSDDRDDSTVAGGPSSEVSSIDTAPVGSSEPFVPTSDSQASTEGDTSAPADTSPEPPIDGEGWTEEFEDGWGGWTSHGAFEIGPTSGSAPAPQSGEGVVGTGLDGTYPRQNARLSSPRFIVPRATDQPRLRYWYWYDLEPGDTVQVQIRVGDDVDWVDFHSLTDTISTVAGKGKRWMQGMLPLNQFGDQEIQLSFALATVGATSSVPGFFIDSVSLELGPMDVCSCRGFNVDGAGDWSIEGGQWGIGAGANAQAPAPKSGSGLAGTNLLGSYESLAAAPEARLASPSYWVNGTSHNVEFYYWHSFSSGARGKIQVRVVGQPWQDLPSSEFTGASAADWTHRVISLDPWEGEDIQFGFLIENGAGVGTPTTPGFYVDEFKFQ